jgi:hypothetical protein
MMKSILALCVLASACATPQQPDMVGGRIDSFTDYELDRTMPLHFSTKGQDLSQRQITSACEQAAIDSGLTVKDDSKDTLVVSVAATVTGTTQGPTVTMVPHRYSAYQMPMAVSSTATLTNRQIMISVTGINKPREEVLRATILSSGNSPTVAPVAYEMCRGYFGVYPNNQQGLPFQIISTDQK